MKIRMISAGRISNCRTASPLPNGQPGSPRQIPRSLTAALWQSFSAEIAILLATPGETGRSVGMTDSPLIPEVGPGAGVGEFGMTVTGSQFE